MNFLDTLTDKQFLRYCDLKMNGQSSTDIEVLDLNQITTDLVVIEPEELAPKHSKYQKTPTQVAEDCKRMLQEGASYKAIANRLHIGKTTIARIKNGKHYLTTKSQ